MTTPSKYQQFASTIRAIFAQGLTVNQRTHQSILSMVPMSTPHDLKTILTDPSTSDSASLIELIYFPNETTQMRLEERLEAEDFEQKDQNRILAYLLSVHGNTLIRFEHLQTVLSIETPEHGARTFLERLNISRHLDTEFVKVIHKVSGIDQGRKYKVWLRNMVITPRQRDIQFLKNLFLKMGPLSNRFDKYLTFSLRFLEESRNETDLFQALIQHKNRCLKHLQQNSRFETLRHSHNMETLMAQGVRIPHMDKQALLLQVSIVDDICLALFKKSM